jgi:DNA-binding transcriptional MerR regulator
MKLNKEDLARLIDDMSLLDDIELSQIPDIDLYMDQLTKFFDDKMGHLKRDGDDKILTKTMINNYTKAGILMPPKNKKYSQRHMILLILIYYLKQILSINDIKAIMAPILNNINTAEDDIIPLEEIYSTILEIKHREFESFCDGFDDKLKEIGDKTKTLEGRNKELADLFLTVLILVAQADAQKRLAEKIIDNYFSKSE